MNQPTALDLTSEFESIVNRNYEHRCIMDRIDRDLQYVRFAKRLSNISLRRRKHK